VQFTRDPSGLRGALVKIGASSAGSRVGNPEVEEVAHMLFAPGMRRLFATHPPLLERLKAIDPRFDPKEIDSARARMAAAAAEREAPAAPAAAMSIVDLPAAAPAMIAGLVGNPGTAHMQLAREIRESLPEAIVTAGRHPQSARALLLALALDANPEIRARQKQAIALRLSAEIAAVEGALECHVDALQPEQRIPALLRAFPALRQLTHEERVQLMACLNGMLPRDGAVSLHSYVLRKLAQMHLRDDLNPRARPSRLTLQAVQQDAQVLFSHSMVMTTRSPRGVRTKPACIICFRASDRPTASSASGQARSTWRSAGSTSLLQLPKNSWSRRWSRRSLTTSSC
jgi:hypothetical protein